MNDFRKLAGQTVVYGLGTIVPRFLHYAVLTPFYTRIFIPSEYGVVTELYSWMVLALVILTYGMETGFFRFSNQKDSETIVFGTTIVSVGATSLLFLLLANVFIEPFSAILNYSENTSYIRLFAVIVAVDAFTAIPFASLRNQNRPLKFSIYKIINVALTIGLVFFFYVVAPRIYAGDSKWIRLIYDPAIGVGYVFIANTISSVVTLLLLLPEVFRLGIKFDFGLWKRMIGYSIPLLIGGVAGSLNEVFDKISMRRLVGGADALGTVGEYGAGYKVAVLMALFIQMFRFAAEPFFFEKAKYANAKNVYAFVMKNFVIISLLIFLGINLYIGVVQYIIDEVYWDSLVIVPIVTFGYLLYGIFLNQSVWYKVNDMTRFGAYITIAGALITIVINIIFVPLIGYMASAWAHVVAYGFMLILSWVLGQKYYPIDYNIKKLVTYGLVALAILAISMLIPYPGRIIELGGNTLLIILFIGYAEKRDKFVSLIIGRK